MNDDPHVLINNVDMEKFDLCVMERPDIPTPTRQQLTIDNKLSLRGTSRIDTGWGDIEIELKFNYLNIDNRFQDSFRKHFYNVRKHILNAKTLRFNDDLGVEYEVKQVVIGDATSEILEHGVFKVKFTCDPFPYKMTDSVLNTVNAGGKFMILNDGNYTSLPIITMNPKLNAGTFPSLITLVLRNVETRERWVMNIRNWGDKDVKGSRLVLDSGEASCYFINNNTGLIKENWGILEFDDFPILDVGEYVVEYQHSSEGGTANLFRMEIDINRRLVY